jgi:hypothetical protein
MSAIAAVGWGAGALLVALWLAVSFMKQGRRREILEWVAATSMYVALLMLFTNLVLRARAAESMLGTVAFGFLWLVFAGGLLVSAVNTLRSLRSAARTQAQSATH